MRSCVFVPEAVDVLLGSSECFLWGSEPCMEWEGLAQERRGPCGDDEADWLFSVTEEGRPSSEQLKPTEKLCLHQKVEHFKCCADWLI